MHLTQTLQLSPQNWSTLSPRCLQNTIARHLHQHQQPFVTFNSPSLFDTAPQIRCIPQITYPELEAEEPRASLKQRQLAEPLIYLFIYFPFRHHAKSIQTSYSNSPVFEFSPSIFSTSHAPLLPPRISRPVLPTQYALLSLSTSASPRLV